MWLYEFIEYNNVSTNYDDLILYLSSKPFIWSVKRDEDRAKKGLELRDIFADSYGFDRKFWTDFMPEKCTMLEMMIALSKSCENIICDPEYGDRTAKWFWMMVENLGLSEMDKFNFDRDYCDEVVDRMLKRRYLRDGRGGLFVTKNPKIDMRKAEIWYQANVWLEENF